MTIGFIGGCINNQIGIKREDLFYSVTSQLLSNSHISHQIALGNYLSFDRLPEEVLKFIEKKQPSIIYLFIRPFPLIPLQKPFVKYGIENKKIRYALHPSLFTRSLHWNDKFTKHESENNFQFVKKSAFTFRDINLFAGVLLGLHRWALNYLTFQLNSVKHLCLKNGIQLKIISPPQNPESFAGNLICKWTTTHLKKHCSSIQSGYININSFPLADFEKDKIHFNRQGHKKLGELIFNDIKHDPV